VGEFGGGYWGSATFGGVPAAADDYLDGLIELLPPGSYSRDEGSDNVRDLAVQATGLGEEGALQLDDLEDNAVPDLAVETIPDWERLLRRPPAAGDDLPARRARIIAACRERLGFRPAELVAMLEPSLGPVTIIEQTLADLAAAGTARRTPALAIPDGGSVTDEAYSYQEGGLQGVFRVYCRITHSRMADLRVEIVHPSGATHVLAEAGSWVAWGTEARWWSVYPSVLSPSWRGLACAGTWRLRVTDTAAGEAGTLDEWEIGRAHV